MNADEIRLYCRSKGYSEAYTSYWILHQSCEVCQQIYPAWRWRASVVVHHIRTRGAGGQDTAENLLALCRLHHGYVHAMGDLHLAKTIGGQVGAKIEAVKI
jgi:hypothetical protein